MSMSIRSGGDDAVRQRQLEQLPELRRPALPKRGAAAAEPAAGERERTARAAASDPSERSATADDAAAMRTRLQAADSGSRHRSAQPGAARAAGDDDRSRIEDADLATALAERTRDRILLDLQRGGQRAVSASPRQQLDVLG